MILNNESHEKILERRFLQFLIEFRLFDEKKQEYVQTYVEEANVMQANDRSTLYLNFEHLSRSENFGDIALGIQTDYYRFEPYLRRSIQDFMFRVTSENQEGRIYYLSIYNMSSVDKIRDLKANKIGCLTTFQGTVTRSSEVRPELLAGSFDCLMCGKKILNIEQQFKYTEPKKCNNLKCDNRTKWTLDQANSIFTDFQKVRVQEDPKDIPAGSMPRSIDVILHNEECEQAKPGDKCLFVGMLNVIPDIYSLSKPGERNIISKGNQGDLQRGQTLDGITGLKKLGVRDLQYKFVFIANHVESTSNRFNLQQIENEDDQDDFDDPANIEEKRRKQFTDDEIREALRFQSQPNLYANLASSIAPAVYGHEEVKKGILLMLMGGVNKKTKEGVNIRGDINVCIVGDPSTAKSQFLKFTCSFLPRAVYTSGKASSAAGLTASVSRDVETGEFCIEAGALMLADNGVCCIDEFDKMDSKDQVAIHEAMEQQTISIAKAGIHATLNARASILAAANPIFGRYDRSKTLKFNVNMSQPIMSRFDLFFVITDQSLEFVDQLIATHIVKLHSQQESAIAPMFSTDELLRYLRYARTIKPIFTKDAAEYLKQSYIRLRQNDQTSNKASYRMTVRQLESLIRLSEALARVHGNQQILVNYVREAERLLASSQINVDKPDVDLIKFDQDGIQNIKDNLILEELKQREEQAKRLKNKLQITYDDYFTIQNTIIQYFKIIQIQREEQIVETIGIIQQDVVDWYLERKIHELNSEEELIEYDKIVHLVIEKMIKQEQILIIVKDDPLRSQRQLSLHANYN